MTKTEIITALRGLSHVDRAAVLAEFRPVELAPCYLEDVRQFREALANAKPIPQSEWTPEMIEVYEEAMKEKSPARLIDEVIADIRAGKYESEGL